MENFELQNNQMGVLNQGVNFFKDYVKSGDDLTSNVSKNISEIVNNYNNSENISEASKERVAIHCIDANAKIACDRNVCTVLSVGLGFITLLVGGSLIAGGFANNNKDS